MDKQGSSKPKQPRVKSVARPDRNQAILAQFQTALGQVNTSVLEAQKAISSLQENYSLTQDLAPQQLQELQNEIKRQKVNLSDLQRATGLLWKTINSLRIERLKQSTPQTAEALQRQLELAEKKLAELKAQQALLKPAIVDTTASAVNPPASDT